MIDNKNDFEFKFPEGYTPPERVEHNISEILAAGEADLKESQIKLNKAINKRDSIKQRITETEKTIADLKGKLPELKENFEQAVFDNTPTEGIQREMQEVNSSLSTHEMCLSSLKNALPIIQETITHLQNDIRQAECSGFVVELIKLAPQYNETANRLAHIIQSISKALFNIKNKNPDLLAKNNIPGLDFGEFSKVINHLEQVPVLFHGFESEIKLGPKDFRYYWIYRPKFDLPGSYAHLRDFTFEEPWDENSPYLEHSLKGTDQEGNVTR
ncbi:MAG: hypothetical protein GXY77_02505 [Fibrobacter sp.]|nr:hypothetical protein [Fibrobacter sp.]